MPPKKRKQAATAATLVSFGGVHAQPQSLLLSQLPESVLVQVLARLTVAVQHKVVVRVCKEMRRLVLLPQTIPNRINLSELSPGSATGVTKFLNALKVLLASRGLAAGAEIKALTIGNHQFGKTTFKKLLELVPDLEELCCPSTKKLGIGEFKGLSVTAAPHLKSFEWGWAYDAPESSFVENFIAGRTKLEVLRIRNWEGMMTSREPPGDFCGASDRLVLALAQSCPNLRELEVCGSIHISLVAARALSAACCNLKKVNLRHSPLFTHRGPDGRYYLGSSDSRDSGAFVRAADHAPAVAAVQTIMIGAPSTASR